MPKQMISFEATEELKELLRIKAFQNKTTISALIRDILYANLKKDDINTINGEQINDNR